MSSVQTRAVARLLLAPVLMVAAAVLVTGYVDVGDGFAAGVVAALGVLVQYLAFGRAAVERALPVRRAAHLAVGGRSWRWRSRSCRRCWGRRRSSTRRRQGRRWRGSAAWS